MEKKPQPTGHHDKLEEASKDFLRRLPPSQRPKEAREPQEQSAMVDGMKHMSLDRVADDYDIAVALGMNPKTYKYTESGVSGLRQALAVERQAREDLAALVNEHASTACYYRKKEKKQVEQMQEQIALQRTELEACKAKEQALEKTLITLQEVVLQQAARLEELRQQPRKGAGDH